MIPLERGNKVLDLGVWFDENTKQAEFELDKRIIQLFIHDAALL